MLNISRQHNLMSKFLFATSRVNLSTSFMSNVSDCPKENEVNFSQPKISLRKSSIDRKHPLSKLMLTMLDNLLLFKTLTKDLSIEALKVMLSKLSFVIFVAEVKTSGRMTWGFQNLPWRWSETRSLKSCRWFEPWKTGEPSAEGSSCPPSSGPRSLMWSFWSRGHVSPMNVRCWESTGKNFQFSNN